MRTLRLSRSGLSGKAAFGEEFNWFVKRLSYICNYIVGGMQTSQTSIWGLLKAGDPQALLALYDEYYIALTRYGLKLTADPELTRDCITQVLLRLWDKRDRLPPVEHIRSYLFTCLRRELFAELRSGHVRIISEGRSGSGAEQESLSYEECLIRIQTNREIREKLAGAFVRLTRREKELLRLKFFEIYSYDEIALQCGISKRTAYNIIHHALNVLRTALAGKLSLYDEPVGNPLILILIFCLFFPG
jgi:RNA polymerase sigma-70 factor (ECF subfamily)